jgi:hypothetical protein
MGFAVTAAAVGATGCGFPTVFADGEGVSPALCLTGEVVTALEFMADPIGVLQNIQFISFKSKPIWIPE